MEGKINVFNDLFRTESSVTKGHASASSPSTALQAPTTNLTVVEPKSLPWPTKRYHHLTLLTAGLTFSPSIHHSVVAMVQFHDLLLPSTAGSSPAGLLFFTVSWTKLTPFGSLLSPQRKTVPDYPLDVPP